MAIRPPAVFASLCGVMVGIGAYTFRYAEGLSYFSNRPEACANCHVMRDHLDSWQKSSHHTRASCNDCHTPHELLPKFLTKAENGWRHSVGFTLQRFPDPLRITPRNAQRVEHNCLSCHQGLVSEIFPAGADHASDLTCIDCHAGVGHGPRR